ncbi:MAG: hypothetical protein IKY49_01505, partial [Paludibacteraceae bacterium]|nr:hypothetical protein [Paludibacteraceae bacterium]
MKKIFTKLFLLTAILLASSEIWAQASEYVTCSSTLQPGAEGYATRVILENTNNYDCSPDVISFKTTAQEEPYPFQRASVYGDGSDFEAIGLSDIHGAIMCSLEQNYYNNAAGEQSYTFNLPEGLSGQYIYGLMIEHGLIQFKDFKITNYYYTWEASKSINAAASTYSFEVDYSAYGIPTKASDLSVELTGENPSAFKVTSEDLGNKVRYTVTYNHNTVGDHYARLKVNYNSTICGNSVTGHARALNLHGQTTKVTPTVTAWPTLNAVTYGTNLGDALKLKGGSASVPGTFAIANYYSAGTVPNAGTYNYNVTFTPNDVSTYNTVNKYNAVVLTVNKADQAIVWTTTPPTELTVGDSHTLSATALGGAVSYVISGDAATLAGNTLTAEKEGTVTITASQAGNGNYNAAANVTHTITINKATPTVTAWPTIAAVTYGASLEQALVLVGGEASVAGTFAITDSYNAADVPNAGTHTYNLEFRPTESNKYNNVSGGTATLVVNKADQVLTWSFADCTLLPGQTLALDATSTCGAVSYELTGSAISVSGNTLTAEAAGTATIKAVDAGNSNYNAVESSVYTVTVSESGYTRAVTNGNYGTICLPYGSSSYAGAEFYEIAYAEIKNGDATGLYLDQLEEGAALVAGKPYIFKATADELTVSYEGAMATT